MVNIRSGAFSSEGSASLRVSRVLRPHLPWRDLLCPQILISSLCFQPGTAHPPFCSSPALGVLLGTLHKADTHGQE